MTQREKRKLQRDFFDAAGPNTAAFRALIDTLPDVGFYMKDLDCRIMALNRRNCDFCNIRDELDAVGLRSCDLFPAEFADSFMTPDRIVMETGRPLLDYVHRHPADRSLDIHVKSVFPVRDKAGRLIGTAGIYYKRPPDGVPDWHGRMKAVTDWIAKNYARPVSSAGLAEIAQTSEPNFRRQFSCIFGISPGRYVNTIRLNAARRLLEKTDRLVSDIAVATGFFDQSHFTKIFKRERGVTPGEYRRRHRPANLAESAMSSPS